MNIQTAADKLGEVILLDLSLKRNRCAYLSCPFDVVVLGNTLAHARMYACMHADTYTHMYIYIYIYTQMTYMQNICVIKKTLHSVDCLSGRGEDIRSIREQIRTKPSDSSPESLSKPL